MIIYGKQVCLHALEQHEDKIKTVYVAQKGAKAKGSLPKALFHKYHDKIKFLEEKWAQSMSKGGNHQGLLIEMEDFQQSTFAQLKKNNFILILDTLTDVGNIGAIVRSAYALGVESIIATGVKQLNFAAIARSSSGALLNMPFMIVPNILDTLNELKQLNFSFYGAVMDGVNVQEITFDKKRVLVMGSEGKGLSGKVTAKLDYTVSIEMQHAFDSLNVSAAAAILIHRMNDATQ
ncbi:MAG: 23S rRNA (guanosine(2251)-2'-O)-methyltransferase RlmB [Epsilonproteobacteria bacterium]|nr:MAG: 23S rRNA (guanosine(2251)-2'-O)-methyltransferase RlmB [Campylobacterota bacterium]